MSELWQQLSARLRASEPYGRLLESLGSARGLPLPAAAWVADLVATDLDRPLLVVVPRESDALVWLEAAELFGAGASYFSAPALTPYQETEVSLLVRAQEAVALDSLLRLESGVDRGGECRTFVCTPRALFRRLPTRRAFEAAVRVLRPAEETPPEQLAEHLSVHGFRRQDLVAEVGDFAVRGGVFDLFPPGRESPVRLDLFGDTIESLRSFSVEDQRSREELEEVRVLPLSLFRAGPQEARLLAEVLAGRAEGRVRPLAAEQLEALRTRGRFAGWEASLPALAEETLDLVGLLEGCLAVALDRQALLAEVEVHRERLQTDYDLRLEQGRLVLSPEALELPADRVLARVEGFELSLGDLDTGPTAVDFGGTSTDSFHGQLPRFPREVETAAARHERLVVVTAPDHRSRLDRLCETYDLAPGAGGVWIESGSLQRGFRLPAIQAVLFGEPQLFPRSVSGPPARRTRYGPFVSGLRDLRVGDFVVHSDHGIARFSALRAVGGAGDRGHTVPTHLSDADDVCVCRIGRDSTACKTTES